MGDRRSGMRLGIALRRPEFGGSRRGGMRGRNLGRTLELEGGDDGEVIRKKGNIAG
jgi:hypothetical protein